MRYLQKLGPSPAKPELGCLSCAVWTHGALCCKQPQSVQERYYRHSRSLLEQLEMGDDPTSYLSLETLQACVLIALYEIQRAYSARAWASAGRALRLAQWMKLHLLDDDQASVSPTQGKGKSRDEETLPMGWLELEEKRRAFWMGFILDRCMNNGGDWPMMLEGDQVCASLQTPEPLTAFFLGGT